MAFSSSQPLHYGAGQFRAGAATGPEGARLYLFRMVAAPRASQPAGFAGVNLASQFVREAMARAIAAARPLVEGAPPEFALFENGRQIFATAAWPGSAEARSSLAPLFPPWEVAVAYSGATVATVARDQFHRNLLLAALAFAGLALGAFATFTMAAREARLARMKAAFVSGVSHDMKTPLALISMYAETLETGRISGADKLQQYCRTIGRESRKLTQLIDRVLDFSRLESGRANLKLELIDAGALAERIAAEHRDRLSAAGFQFAVEIEPGVPWIRADGAALSQAVANLLDNAEKYSDDRKEIRLAVRHLSGMVAIEVSDKGIGIEPADHERIFDQFYRAGDPLTQNVRGSGLGLALARRIVDAHSGRIELRSARGSGSTFSILLPACRPAENAA